jgi:integrase
VLCLHIRRGIVYAVVGDVKSSASRSNLRLAPFLIQALQGWRRETPYVKPSDWIFASPRTRGKKPYRGNSLVRR